MRHVQHCIGKLKSILAATKTQRLQTTTEYNTYKGIKRRCFNKNIEDI